MINDITSFQVLYCCCAFPLELCAFSFHTHLEIEDLCLIVEMFLYSQDSNTSLTLCSVILINCVPAWDWLLSAANRREPIANPLLLVHSNKKGTVLCVSHIPCNFTSLIDF